MIKVKEFNKLNLIIYNDSIEKINNLIHFDQKSNIVISINDNLIITCHLESKEIIVNSYFINASETCDTWRKWINEDLKKIELFCSGSKLIYYSKLTIGVI